MLGTIEGLYLVTILPAFFALTMLAQGIYKITQKDKSGWRIMLLGMLILAFTVCLYTVIYN